MSETVAVHAHRCVKCLESGKQTIWMHNDTDRGDVAKHTCPECGTVNWKKWLVEPGKLPSHNHAVKGGINYDAILGWIVIIVGIAAISYIGYLYIKSLKKETPIL